MLFPIAALAQDPFEIQVYEYETVPKGRWSLETHLNYVGVGTKTFAGPVAPTNNQFRLTFELTRGITDEFEMAGYLLTAHKPEIGYEFAGWRVRPRVRFPRSWGLPLDVSISAEVGFPRRQYDENGVTLEIRPIVEKIFGRFQIDINPIVGRALRGPGTAEGWIFGPTARVGYKLNPRLDLSLEYYSEIGPLGDLPPPEEQVHLIVPGGDLTLSHNLTVNFGVGFGTSNAADRLIYKMRIGYLF